MRTIGTAFAILLLAGTAWAQEDNPYGDFSYDDSGSDAGTDDGGNANPYGSFGDDGSGGDDANPYGSFGGDDAELIAVGDDAGEPEPDPLPVYVALDQASTTLSPSRLQGFGTTDLDSAMWRLRVGAKFIERVGFELQLGTDASDNKPGQVQTDQYVGFYLVPHARMLDTVDFSFPVGIARTTVVQADGTEADLDSAAFGISVELPLRLLSDGVPDLRLTGGWMVYHQKSDARLYGANVGVRWDFTTAGISAPDFSGVGDFFSGLWPFGDDDAE